MAGEHDHGWMLDGDSGGFYCGCGQWVGVAGFTALLETKAQLERRIEEAVEPYREALKSANRHATIAAATIAGFAAEDVGAQVDAVIDVTGRALLGGTPTKEGE